MEEVILRLCVDCCFQLVGYVFGVYYLSLATANDGGKRKRENIEREREADLLTRFTRETKNVCMFDSHIYILYSFRYIKLNLNQKSRSFS